VLAILALALIAAPAFAATAEREEYGELAEPICKRNTEANERILAGVRKLVREDKLKPAAAKFAKAARALETTRKELVGLPRPSADAGRLRQWFAAVSEEVALFRRVATKLRQERKGEALRMVGKLTTTAMVANNRVLPFEFTYCRFDPARFT
jgi:hypothetical protein